MAYESKYQITRIWTIKNDPNILLPRSSENSNEYLIVFPPFSSNAAACHDRQHEYSLTHNQYLLFSRSNDHKILIASSYYKF